MGRFTMSIVRSYASKPNAEDITAGRCKGSIFLFVTDFRSQKTISKKDLALLAVITDSELVFINIASHFVENL